MRKIKPSEQAASIGKVVVQPRDHRLRVALCRGRPFGCHREQGLRGGGIPEALRVQRRVIDLDGFVGNLEKRCDEEEHAVFCNRPAQRAADLLIAAHGFVLKRVERGQVRVAEIVRGGTVEQVGPRFAGHVDHSPGGPSELSREDIERGVKFLKSIQVQRGSVSHAAAGIARPAAEVGEVVGAIEGDIRVDAFLTRKGDPPSLRLNLARGDIPNDVLYPPAIERKMAQLQIGEHRSGSGNGNIGR